MPNAVLYTSDEGRSPSGRAVAVLALGLWLAMVACLGALGVFAAPPGAIPFALIAGVNTPVMGFLLAYRFSSIFREFVLSADLRLLVAIQGWRFLGMGFIALHVNGILPGIFAWPAGIGDMVVAAAAPWMLMGLIQQPGFVKSKAFLAWNWLGIFDLVNAVSMGALGSGLLPQLVADGVTTAPMAHLPLILIPAYLVPLMVMFHVTALLQARNKG